MAFANNGKHWYQPKLFHNYSQTIALLLYFCVTSLTCRLRQY